MATPRPPRAPRRTGPRRPPQPPRVRLPPARVGNPDRRLRFALVAALVVFTVFGGRLFQLQGLDASALAAKALASRSITEPLPAHRGDILDTTGAVLATTVERRNITVDQRLVSQYLIRDDVPNARKGVAGAARVLSPVLRLSVPALVKKLSGDRRFGYVVKGVAPNVWREVARLGIPGLFSEQASRRTYSNGQVAASVIGFLGKDGTPLSGIERTENGLLQGTDGKLTYEQGRNGQQIATGLSSETEPVAGRSVQLTIDRDLAWKAQEALARQVKLTGARSGQAVILDTRNGDVLALADAPTFNANAPGAAPAADRENRTLIDVFEPGSTSKVITAAAALEEHKVKPGTRLKVDGTIRRGGKTFHDSHQHAVENLTFAGVLAKSSNVGTIRVGEKLSPATMHDYLTRFGLGSPTGVGLPESRGILAPAREWSNSQRYTVLFGQGLSVTALQSASVFATIANNGVRVTPRLIKATTDAEGRMKALPAAKKTRVVSAKTAKQLRLILESVVGDDGTAVEASIPGYRVAGKTGTAQAYDDKCHCYAGYTASFVGMAPADDPRLVVAVFLQQPVRGYYGGTVAAPVFQEVMTYALAREGVAPSGTKAPRVPLDWR
jgi:cell division protein FtsI (penicillin-binding protein 3)